MERSSLTIRRNTASIIKSIKGIERVKEIERIERVKEIERIERVKEIKKAL
jgi:hypothetical protein